MIYLENSTNIQNVYIPRQEIKKDALTKYVTENELDDAIANETARTEETYMKKGEMPDMSAYTPTSGFSTINGSAITNGDNLEIDGASYSAGTNISIDEDNVISVTGITVPTKLSDLNNDEGFVDSGDVQTQIDNSISGKADADAFSAYTPTSGFSTINGSAITDGSNIVVEETPYSGGTNIDITDHVISVTGITVPTNVSDLNDDIGIATTAWTNSAITDATSGLATEQYVDNAVSGKADTSAVTASIAAATAATTGWVENQGYLTAYTETDPVFMASAASGITSNDISNWDNKLDASALTQYYTSAQTDTAIENATSGKADTSAFTEYWTSAQTESAISNATEDFVTSADVETQITDKGYITGYTETDPIFQASAASGITSEDITNWNGKLDSSALTPYYTSAQTDTAINNAVSGKADISRVDEVEEVTAIALNNLNNRVDTISANTPDLTPYWTSAETQSAITNSVSGKVDTSAMTEYYTSAQTQSAITDSISGKADASRLETVERVTSIALNDLNTRVDEISGTTPDLSAYTPTSGFSTINGSAITEGGNIVISGGGGDMSQYWTSAETQSAITNSVSGKADSSRVDEVEEVTAIALNSLQSNKQETLVSGDNIKTINHLSLLGSGNINIQGGSGGTNIIELTQAEYDALTAYTEDAVYVITDAQEINLSDFITTASTDYWTSAQTESAITNAVSGKTDKVSVTANGSNHLLPKWNDQGCITGYTQQVYNRNFYVNGVGKTMVQTTNSDLPSIYAPTSAGTQNQVLLSSGSGAPVWSSFKFAFMTQAEYDLITPDASTIYFITD